MGVMVMFNFKLNQKEKKSMFILGLISFAVWFVNPFYSSGFFSIIVISVIEQKLNPYHLWAMSWPFIGVLLNCSLYFVYLKSKFKNRFFNPLILILIGSLLLLFMFITFLEAIYLNEY